VLCGWPVGHDAARLRRPVELVEPRDGSRRPRWDAGREDAEDGTTAMRIKISIAMAAAAAAIVVTQTHWLHLA
jgi:hypothetical protein